MGNWRGEGKEKKSGEVEGGSEEKKKVGKMK